MYNKLFCSNIIEVKSLSCFTKQIPYIFKFHCRRQQPPRRFINASISIPIGFHTKNSHIMCFPWRTAKIVKSTIDTNSNTPSTTMIRKLSKTNEYEHSKAHLPRTSTNSESIGSVKSIQSQFSDIFISNDEHGSRQRSSISQNKSVTRHGIVDHKYRIGSILGTGSFGTVYACTDITNSINEEIAIKILKKKGHQSYYRETKALTFLQQFEINGIPKLYHHGSFNHKDVMVMTKLGKDLSTLFIQCGKKFSLTTVLKLSIQMITHLESIHNASIIHRDIKPHNFLIGCESNSNNTYLIDFGLAKHYKDVKKSKDKDNQLPIFGRHIRKETGLTPVGTARYASTWTHMGIAQSRRDDLEALGFILVYFFHGRVPWQGIPLRNRQDKWKKIGDVKKNTPLNQLCKDLPKQFVSYFEYVRKLSFTEKPDYNHLKQLFSDAAKENKINLDKSDWDWDIKK